MILLFTASAVRSRRAESGEGDGIRHKIGHSVSPGFMG